MSDDVKDPFADIDISDEAAVQQRLAEMAAAEFEAEPEIEDREEADRVFRERKAAYLARLRARGMDPDDPEADRRQLDARYREYLASSRQQRS